MTVFIPCPMYRCGENLKKVKHIRFMGKRKNYCKKGFFYLCNICVFYYDVCVKRKESGEND